MQQEAQARKEVLARRARKDSSAQPDPPEQLDHKVIQEYRVQQVPKVYQAIQEYQALQAPKVKLVILERPERPVPKGMWDLKVKQEQLEQVIYQSIRTPLILIYQ